MSSEECQITYIPCKPPFAAHQQPTVNVLASFIQPKFAHILVRKLNQVAPLENLHHVKRIRKECLEGNPRLSIILCLAGDGDSETHDNCVPEDVNDLISSYQLRVFVAKVCKYAATSKEEWEEQCKLWPSSFHPPTYNIEGISGFSEEGSKSVFNYMNLAFKLATSRKEFVNAAVIVDPSSDQVISTACDELHSWHVSDGGKETENHYFSYSEDQFFPFRKCSSSVKQLPSNGPFDEPESCSYPAFMCLNPQEWSQKQLSSSSSGYFHPLRHAAMVAIEYSSDRDRSLYLDTRLKDDESFQVDSSVATGSLAKKMKIMSDNVSQSEMVPADNNHSDSTRPYLCTGYDIYLAWEPCVMCAMALVHQRIRRIFYALPNPNTGALGSVYRLQGEKSLNHHYAVFQVTLSNNVLGGCRVQNDHAAEESDLKEA